MLSLLLSTALAQDLVITHARVIDGTGAPPISTATLLVRDGRIAAIWPGETPPPDLPDLETLDVAGATVMPGWFDAHVHLYADAGAAMRGEPLVWDAAAMDRRLRAYVASGVTSVLDAGAPHELVHAIRAFEQTHVGPEISFLGGPLSPPDGYLDRLETGLPAHATQQDFSAHMDALTALGAAGVKVTVENGFVAPIWPIFSADQLGLIHQEADARDLGIFVHAMTAEEQLHALHADPQAFVHTAFDTSPRHVEAMAESGVWQVSTLAVVDGMRLTHHPERLARPLVQTVVPERVRECALDPDIRRTSAQAVQHIMAPGLPGPAAAIFRVAVVSDATYRAQVRRMQKTLSRLHQAGVPIVLGSDTANWSVLTGFPHGMTTLREAELLEEAGLSPMEVIVAGTSRAAELLGVADDRGRIAVGQRADLVILADDPLAGMEAVWSVLWTVKDGVAKTPEQWMAGGEG